MKTLINININNNNRNSKKMQSDPDDNSIAVELYLDVMKFQSYPMPSNDQDNQGLLRFTQEIEWVSDVVASVIIQGRAPVAHT